MVELDLPKKRVVVGPAQLWKRILAFLIDILLVDMFIITPFRSTIMTLVGFKMETFSMIFSAPANPEAIAIVFGFASVFVLFYFVLTDYLLGQGVGKMILNIYVVSIEGDVQPGFWRCVLRSLFVIPLQPFQLLWILDPIFMIFNKNNQRLTEFIGKTATLQAYSI
ncbi:MAG: RDD family protein [Candidatus Nanoarchaeia archaeon]